MKRPPELPEIPFDSITEVLSWLPVESLLRFKCVCKQWRSLIQYPYFVEIHTLRATPTLLPYTREGSYYLHQSFAGLVLEMNRTTKKYHVRNPATRQVLDLPNPHPGIFLIVTAFDLLARECKLLARYLQPRQHLIDYNWEILSVGMDEHWRALKPGRDDEENGQGVRWIYMKTDRSVHFVRIPKINGSHDSDLKVVSLDLWKESFEYNSLPRGFFSDLSKVFLFLWDNCVSVADIRDEECNVLVLKKNKGNYKWSDSKIVVPLRFIEENGYAVEKLVPVKAASDGLWFRFDKRIKFCCDAKTGRIKVGSIRPDESRSGFEYQKSTEVKDWI